MSVKHTPGPWYREGDLIRGDYGYVCDTRGALLTEANARLIAAAPEMLEALKWLRDHPALKDIPEGVRAGIVCPIAKAEGREA